MEVRPLTVDSILTSTKLYLGIVEEYTHFDSQLISHINSIFSILTQLGVGPSTGFMIDDPTDTWDKFLSNQIQLEFVKSYVHAKVKLMFDPPTSSAAMEALNKIASELEWRIQVAVDPIEST